MTRRNRYLVALLAVLAVPAALGEEFSTSSGVHSLPPLTNINNEAQLNQAAGAAERTLTALLADISALEGAQRAATTELSGITPQVRAEQAAVDKAKAAWDTMDGKYRADLASFQQKQTDLDAEIQRQRQEAAALEALPSAQRDYASIERLNRWAADIGTRRDAIAAERERLLVDHAAVEAERMKVAKMRSDAEARLKTFRDNSIGHYGEAEARVEQAYAQLGRAIAYLEQAHALRRSKFERDPDISAVLDRASLRLHTYEARRAKR